jgi:YfiH family protein
MSSDAAADELGGGFTLQTWRGEGVVIAPGLSDCGVRGFMSTAGVNARLPEDVGRFAQAAGLLNEDLATLQQAHGASIVRVPPAQPQTAADGLWSDEDGVLTVKIADCAPVWLADTASRRFALLHAGWRGVTAGIATGAVAALQKEGSDPAQLVAAIGPHLQACCFEVGPEVAERFSRWPKSVKPAAQLRTERNRSDSFALDLGVAIAAQLRDSGIREERLFAASACTRCNATLFHSYRRNGAGGPLMIALAARMP